MNRKIDRSYYFSDREVNEIIIQHLRTKDIPAPEFVGDTPNCKWTRDASGGVRVEWSDAAEKVDIL